MFVPFFVLSTFSTSRLIFWCISLTQSLCSCSHESCGGCNEWGSWSVWDPRFLFPFLLAPVIIDQSLTASLIRWALGGNLHCPFITFYWHLKSIFMFCYTCDKGIQRQGFDVRLPGTVLGTLAYPHLHEVVLSITYLSSSP